MTESNRTMLPEELVQKRELKVGLQVVEYEKLSAWSSYSHKLRIIAW